MKVRKAVIPAAGLGTRVLPASKAMPKEMLPIVDKPTIQYIVEEAVASGIEDILLVTGRTKKSIEDHFDYCPELEMELAEKDKQAELELVRPGCTSSGRNPPRDWATRYTAPGALWGTSPLQCCWGTMWRYAKDRRFVS